MNRADVRITARDVIMVNVLKELVGEEVASEYRKALQRADSEIERAFQEREALELANAKKIFEKGSVGD